MVAFVLVFVFCDLLILCSGSPPYAIELLAERSRSIFRLSDTKPTPSLQLGNVFTIYVEADQKPKEIRCTGENNNDEFVHAHLIFFESFYTLEKSVKVTEKMNGIWRCTLLYLSENVSAFTQFTVKVQKPDGDHGVHKVLNTDNDKAIEIEETVEETRTRESRNFNLVLIPNSESPYLHIYILGKSKAVKHEIESMIQLEKHFTISLRILSHLEFSNKIRKIECYKEGRRSQIYVKQELILTNKDHAYLDYIANVTVPATATMQCNWECLLSDNTRSLVHITPFSVVFHQPQAYHWPEVSVNTIEVNTTRATGASNAIGEYYYMVDELANIKCQKYQGMYMRMAFGNDTNSALISTDNLGSNFDQQTMIIKLTEKHHGTFVSCVVVMANYEYVLRLYFKKNTNVTDKDLPNIYVNELPLDPIQTNDGILKYVYEYYNGETLTIKSYVENENIKWFCNTTYGALKPIEKQNTIIDVSVTMISNDDKLDTVTIRCTVGIRDIVIYLTPIPIPLYPSISGISSADTLHRYTNNATNYKINCIYRPNINIALTCTHNVIKNKCKWIYDRDEVSSTNMTDFIVDKYNTNKKKSQSNFMPVQNGKSTTISCNCRINKKVYFQTDVNIYTETPKNIPTTSTESTQIAKYITESTAIHKTFIEENDETSMETTTIAKNDATTNITVTLQKGEKNTIEVKAQSSKVIKNNEIVTIIFRNDYNRNVLKHALCYYNKNHRIEFLDSDLDRNDDIYKHNVTAINYMKYRWKCNISTHYEKDPLIEVEFDIDQPRAGNSTPNPANDIYVNNEKVSIITLKSITSNGTEKQIAKGVYDYHSGELVKIMCKKIHGIVMKLDIENILMSDSPPMSMEDTEQTAYIKLTDKHHGSSIVCAVIVSELPKIAYSFELTLLKINEDKRPNLNVNGLALIPKRSDKVNMVYQYEYYDGEILSIKTNSFETCQVDQDSTNELGPALEEQKDFTTLTVILHHDVNKANLTTLVCGTSESNTTTLELTPIPTFYPTISGLSLAKTLYRYKQSKSEYIIKYIHPVTQNLSLTCVSLTEGCDWDFNSNEVTAVPEESNGLFTNKYWFIRRENYNYTNITCICKAKEQTHKITAEIVYELIEPEQIETEDTNDDIVSAPIVPDVKINYPKDKSRELFVLLAIIAGTVVVVVVVILIIISIIKRKRRLDKEYDSNINYENLPEHNAGAMAPPPVQWDNSHYNQPLTTEDTYTYTVPYVEKNIENMYTKPQPKSQRAPQPTETLYAEIGAQDDPNYAPVGHKGKGKSEYANSEQNRPMYGQILPKSLRNPQSAPQVLPKPVKTENYAEVLPKSERNRPDGTNYTNVFESPRYGNMETKTDYAEPAYCEVNYKRS